MSLLKINMQGKVCLITGANSGIGKATALALALIRLTPGRIISWNLTIGDPAQTHSARNV